MDEPQIPKYYTNKKVLVTGATGFLGKVLIWKLLQSCYMIDTIYVLIRSKYGKSVSSRKQELFGDVIFDEFKTNNPNVLKKVVLISGDMGEDGLGLSSSDRNLLIDEVSVVFHSAAIVKFNADLKRTINVNTLGTLRMLQLAEDMKKLEAFVYISTAYCCCDNEMVEEKLYPVKHNAYDIITLVRWMEPEILDSITPKLINPLPNSYTYTKRLTESLLSDFQYKLPIIVARPTIVIAACKEPLPGWNDNFNGPTGFFIAGGTGILRTTMNKKNAKPNIIAVDIAVNGILILPWANRKENLLKEIAVYNIGETEHEPINWKAYVDLCINSFYKYPFKKSLWSPHENPFTDSIIIYNLKNIFFHWLPAYVIDFILWTVGQKPFLKRVQTKIQQGENVSRYFVRHHWIFANEKMLQINKIMGEADKRIFPITMKEITDDQKYIDSVVLGSKIYLLKEDPISSKFCLRKAQVMYYLDKFVVAVRYFIFYKIVMAIVNIFWDISHNTNQYQQMKSTYSM